MSFLLKSTLVLLMMPLAARAQSFSSYLDKADSLYKAKMYTASGKFYDRAFKIQAGPAQDYYNAACSWALAADGKAAIGYLKKAASKYYLNEDWIQKDSDLKELHQKPEWNLIVQQIHNNVQQLKSRTLTFIERKEILEDAAAKIRKYHFSKDVGQTIADNLLFEFNRHRFDTAISNRSFFWTVTQYLRTTTSDWHFYIGLDNNFWNTSSTTSTSTGTGEPTDQELNYGFKEVKILPGNIGYLNWSNCIANDDAYKKAAAVMALLSDCKSIIIDISDNGGGDGAMGRFLSAYFMGYEKPLTQGECRDGKNDVERTVNSVPGKLLLKTPLYIIISGNTGSAAEYFAHYMKEEKRATILGKKSIGGAHPAVDLTLPYKTFIQIPVCVLWSYSTHKDFEGIGVIPDIELQDPHKIEQALNVIYKN